MKYQIRRGVFETNSSSMHSISIVGSSNYETGPFPEELVIKGGEYGWSAPPLMEYEEKLNYIATDYKDDDDSLEMLKEVYQKYTGKKLIYNLSEGKYDIYIDHQSSGTIDDYLCDCDDRREGLKDLIFNKNKMIIIDNDNH